MTARLSSRLLGSLADDARIVLARLDPEASRPASFHEQIRRQLRRVTRVLVDTRSGIPIHAAACRLTTGKGVLVAGRTRAGKSTLALSLAVERRAAVVADDVVWLENGEARGIGSPVSVRGDSPYWEEVCALWYADRSDRLLVNPEDLGGTAVTQSTRVDMMVFPEFGRSFNATQLRSADAFCRLSRSVLRPLSRDALVDLARLATRVPAVAAGYDDVGGALSAVDVCAELQPSGPLIEPRLLTDEELNGFSADVMGVRMGDDVAVFSGNDGEVALFAGWPEGLAPSVPSWTAMKGSLG